ncbi:MAG: PqqD family protein [Clostridiales bacterium]|nr:PqqD family protein [Clostridiales bacterium]
MRLNKEFQLCSIAGRDFLIPVGTAVVDVQRMLDLNEVGAYIIKLLKNHECTVDELTEYIFQEYEAEKDMIQKDLQAFISKGIEIGFLQE